MTHTLTRSAPEGWQGHDRRIDQAMLEEVAFPPQERLLTFVRPIRVVCQNEGPQRYWLDLRDIEYLQLRDHQ